MDKYETAGDIEFSINVSEKSNVGGEDVEAITVTVASVDLSKDVSIEQVRGNNVLPVGFGVTEIEFGGSVTFEGNGFVDVDGDTYHLEELFTDENGYPIAGSNIVIHHNGTNKQTVYEDVMVTSDGYESSTGELSGVSFDVLAGNRKRQEADSDDE